MKTPTRHLTATRRHVTRLIAIGAAAAMTAGLARLREVRSGRRRVVDLPHDRPGLGPHIAGPGQGAKQL